MVIVDVDREGMATDFDGAMVTPGWAIVGHARPASGTNAEQSGPWNVSSFSIAAA